MAEVPAAPFYPSESRPTLPGRREEKEGFMQPVELWRRLFLPGSRDRRSIGDAFLAPTWTLQQWRLRRLLQKAEESGQPHQQVTGDDRILPHRLPDL